MLLRVSDDLGVTYRNENRSDCIDTLRKVGQFMAGDSKVAVRWVIVDDHDNVVSQCDVMSAQLKSIKTSEPIMMMTEDRYMKQIAERLPNVKVMSIAEALAQFDPGGRDKLTQALENTKERARTDPLFRNEILKGLKNYMGKD